jgi:hypothetical protein
MKRLSFPMLNNENVKYLNEAVARFCSGICPERLTKIDRISVKTAGLGQHSNREYSEYSLFNETF